MLRYLGCNVPLDESCYINIFNDNLDVLQNTQIPTVQLSEQCVAISFNAPREAEAAKIIAPYWLKVKWNVSDITTKQITITKFRNHCKFMSWQPDFHIVAHNRLNDPESSD